MQVTPTESPIGLTSQAPALADGARASAGFARLLEIAQNEGPGRKAGLPLRPRGGFRSLLPPPAAMMPLDRGAAADPRSLPLDRVPTERESLELNPGLQAKTEAELQAEAREAAEELVAVVLVEPILKSLRESSQAAPPFAPTSGQKQFQSMLDAELAHELTSSAQFPLVDRLARDLRSPLRTDALT